MEKIVEGFLDNVPINVDTIKIKESGPLWIDYFNKTAREMLDLTERTNTHILDCVKIPVNTKNRNYQYSTVIKYEGEKMRGYKLGVLRLVTESGGMIEYLIDDTIKTHDLAVVEEEISKTDLIKEGDYLIMDRGFISISFIRKLYEKGIRIIMPARKNMEIYKRAVEEAKKGNNWSKHPNEKRKYQEVAIVRDLKGEWMEESEKRKKPENRKLEEIEFNASVIRIDKEKSKKEEIEDAIKEGNAEDEKYVYIVILSTDIELTAGQIIRKYEQRPEIEEDFRQLKDEWKLGTFTSTKYNYIMCHIAMLIIGYNILNLYKSTEEGRKYINRSMRSVEKEDATMLKKASETYFFVSS